MIDEGAVGAVSRRMRTRMAAMWVRTERLFEVLGRAGVRALWRTPRFALEVDAGAMASSLGGGVAAPHNSALLSRVIILQPAVVRLRPRGTPVGTAVGRPPNNSAGAERRRGGCAGASAAPAAAEVAPEQTTPAWALEDAFRNNPALAGELLCLMNAKVSLFLIVAQVALQVIIHKQC